MSSLKASIDLGTNTARLLIGEELANNSIRTVHLSRKITRLGGGFTREQGISSEAWQRSLAALEEFAALIKKYNASSVKAVATSAVRDALNGTEFCREVLIKTGINLEVIDGTQEACYTLNGVLSALDEKKGSFLVFDVGGGSTEYIFHTPDIPLFTVSLPLGVVRLTEGKKLPSIMKEKIERELSALQTRMESAGVRNMVRKATLVGTAGTATTLAAIDLKMTEYDYRKVNNHIVSKERIEQIYEMLLPLSPQERLNVPGLEKGREDLIVAGILITLSTMNVFGHQELKVSDFGLLEGLLLSE